MSESRCKEFRSSQTKFDIEAMANYTCSLSLSHRKALIDKFREARLIQANLLAEQPHNPNELSQEDIDKLYDEYLNMENDMDTENRGGFHLGRSFNERDNVHYNIKNSLITPFNVLEKETPQHIAAEMKSITESHK